MPQSHHRIRSFSEFCCCWAIFVVVGASPALALNPRTSLTQYTDTIWTQAQGLPQDTVRAITQTQDGYLWIGTNEGLARFDGYEFVTFTKENSILTSSYITALCAAHDGALWIGTRAGLTRYAGGQFKTFSNANAPHRPIEALIEDHQGTLWIASGGSITSFQDGKFFIYNQEALAPLQYAQVVYEDTKHQLWVSGVGGLMKRSGDAFVAVMGRRELMGERITAIRESHDGLWLAGNRGLILLQKGNPPKRFGTRDGLPTNLVRAILEDSAGNLWAGTDSGLTRFVNNQFRSKGPGEEDEDNLVWCLFEDREGDLWIGTNSSLHRLRDDRFTVYGRPEGLPSDEPIAVHQDHLGRIWIGYKNSGVVQFDPQNPQKSRVYSIADGLPSNEIFSIRESANGDLLVGTRAGLSRIRNGHFITYIPPFPPGRRAIYDTLEDSLHRLWVGTMNGVFELSGNTWRRVTEARPGNRGYVVALTETPDGSVFAGGLAGLWRIREGTRVQDEPLQLTPANGLLANPIRAFLPEAHGTLFIGTWGDGILEMSRGKFYRYTAEDGLLSDNVGHIEDDGAGFLWLSTPRGICRVGKQQLRDFRAGKIKKLTPQNYGIEDGLRSAQTVPGINSGTGGTRTSDGRLWFPTGRGLASVDPNTTQFPIMKQPSVPVCKIINVIVDGRAIEPNVATTLRADTAQIQFHYSGIYLRNPDVLRYSYKLEGLDRDWVKAGAHRTTSYNHLRHGSYRFLVRAVLPSGYAGESQFAFVVLPHFYETSWFLLLCVASGLFASYGIHEFHLRQIQRRFDLILQERARLAREIHDTLAQNFVGISSQLEGLALKFDSDHAAARQHLALAQKMARHSVTEARRSVMDLRASELEEEDLPSALTSAAERWVAGTSVSIYLAIARIKLTLSKNVEQNLLRIAQEAVANAIKHAKANVIRIEFNVRERMLHLCIADNGQGFEPSNVFSLSDGHFGILGMRERAEKSGGSFQLATSPGSGTRIEVIIPMG